MKEQKFRKAVKTINEAMLHYQGYISQKPNPCKYETIVSDLGIIKRNLRSGRTEANIAGTFGSKMYTSIYPETASVLDQAGVDYTIDWFGHITMNCK